MATKMKIPRSVERVAAGSPLGGLDNDLVYPGFTLADSVIAEIRHARLSLIDAMKTCDRYDAMDAHRLIGHRVIELDDLIDALKRGGESR